MIRFGQLTEDELFVTAAAAKEGVSIENPSSTDPLVMLKHFGPGNPDAEPLRKGPLKKAESAMSTSKHKFPGPAQCDVAGHCRKRP